MAGPSSRVVMCDFAVADREMDQRPAREAQQRLGSSGPWASGRGRSDTGRSRPATLWVKSVFSSTVATGRPLRNRTRSMRVLVGLRVVDLPHDAQAVGGVAGDDVGVHRQRRLELRQRERLACRPTISMPWRSTSSVPRSSSCLRRRSSRTPSAGRAVGRRQRLPGFGLGRLASRRRRRAGTGRGRGRRARRRRLRTASRARRDGRKSRPRS